MGLIKVSGRLIAPGKCMDHSICQDCVWFRFEKPDPEGKALELGFKCYRRSDHTGNHRCLNTMRQTDGTQKKYAIEWCNAEEQITRDGYMDLNNLMLVSPQDIQNLQDVTREELAKDVQRRIEEAKLDTAKSLIELQKRYEAIEIQLITSTLETVNHNVSQAARILGINRTTLRAKMVTLNIKIDKAA